MCVSVWGVGCVCGGVCLCVVGVLSGVCRMCM